MFKVETYGREVRYLFIKAVADEPAVSYATVYPMAMFARVIIVQLAILLLA